MKTLRWSVCAGLLFGLLGITQEAWASPDLLLDAEELPLAGTHRFRFVRLLNGSRIVVPPYDGDASSSGRLEIIAHWILVDGASSIDAVGAGYRGQPNANGEGNGGGKGAQVSSDATGGGGHGAPGGSGVLLPGCEVITGATGGVIAVAGITDVTFGGAGAAAGSADGDDGGRGGNGGGAILLRAGKIELDGQVIANGEAGGVYSGDSAGGGAGGGILLQASQWLSFGGALLANGAPGGATTKCEGGGGGGGMIRLFVAGVPSDITISQLGGVATCSAAAGADTGSPSVESEGCVDLDGDGFQSDECGGTDCDDSDPSVKLGMPELCNGQDDNCDGVEDNGASASCGGGQCIDGVCVVEDAGTDATADVEQDGPVEASVDAPADVLGDVVDDESGEVASEGGLDGGVDAPEVARGTHVTLRGGCSVGVRGRAIPWGWAALLLVLFVRTKRSKRAPKPLTREVFRP